MAYSALGFSLPDLVVSGDAPPIAAYGGPLTVTVNVTNTAQSSLIEPLALQQGSGSRADSQPSLVGVYLTRNPHRLTHNAIKLGEIATPAVPQNQTVTLTQTFVMPGQRPPTLPGSGGQLYVYFRADNRFQTFDFDRTNNTTRAPEPVEIAAPLPELVATAIEVPPVMQPGDFINPAIKIANLGTVPIGPQGPLLVQLVASTDRQYGPTDEILASYFIPEMAPLSTVPVSASYITAFGTQRTIDEQANEVVLNGPTVQLPNRPGRYYLGVIVDPLNTIREIGEIGTGPSTDLSLVQDVGPPIPGLPPAGQVADPAPALNVFPIPPYGPIESPFQPPNPLAGSVTLLTPLTPPATVAASRFVGRGNAGLNGAGGLGLIPPPDVRFGGRGRRSHG